LYFEIGLKPAVASCLTNAIAPPSIALESCSRAQTDQPAKMLTLDIWSYRFDVQSKSSGLRQNNQITCGFAQGISPVSTIDPIKSSKDSAKLVVCTRKNILVGGTDFL